MKCPKCGSQLRASKQKKWYFLCDTCRTRMSLEYINKMSASSPESISKTSTRDFSVHNRNPKKKLLPIFVTIFLILIGCISLFLHFGLYEKIKTNFSPTEQGKPLSESIDFRILDYEIVSENIKPAPHYQHEYLLVNVEITNNSLENLSVNSMYHFEGYIDNQKIPYCADSEEILKNYGYTLLNSDLNTGETITGYLCFELPCSWESLEIHYSPIVWSSACLTLQIKKEGVVNTSQ